ncbi:uncharacterized protein LOC118740866 [Rhagoletis pomonella]|uniref:uncharacterized protein LOC118740866 n=1 Tax=Rhagoletis pomonella TaxID=28610 RepID=UPI0017826BA2|nr:uncharacterized protein LOC118740866 [Rhagoletis pomonella]
MLKSITALREENSKLVLKADNMHSDLLSMQNSLHKKDDTIDLLRAELNKLRSCVNTVVQRLSSGNLSKNVVGAANYALLPTLPISSTGCPAGSTVSQSAVSSPVSLCDATQSYLTYSAAVANTNSVKLPVALSAYDATRSAVTLSGAAPATSALSSPSSLSSATLISVDVNNDTNTNKAKLPVASPTTLSDAMLSAAPTLLALSSPSSHLSPTQLAVDANVNNVTTAETTSSGTSTKPSPTGWKTVANNKRLKLKQPLLIGANNSNELSVIPNQKRLHVSSFSPTVTAAETISYAAIHACVDAKFLYCYMLVKKDTNLNGLNKSKLQIRRF